MKPQQTIPLLSTIVPAAFAVSPVAVVGVLLGAGLLWLLAERDKEKRESPGAGKRLASPGGNSGREATRATPRTRHACQTITREDLAVALEYGARRFTRKEAVESLQALGFRKTAAYKSLSPGSKFGSLIEFTPDGLAEWKG